MTTENSTYDASFMQDEENGDIEKAYYLTRLLIDALADCTVEGTNMYADRSIKFDDESRRGLVYILEEIADNAFYTLNNIK